jgi:hypothetical protein
MISHRHLYESIVETFVRQRGSDADRNWRAFLWCATVRPDIWAKVAANVDIEKGNVDWLGIEREFWSGGERLLLSLARALYENHGVIPVADLSRLDGELWATSLRALKLHRGDQD